MPVPDIEVGEEEIELVSVKFMLDDDTATEEVTEPVLPVVVMVSVPFVVVVPGYEPVDDEEEKLTPELSDEVVLPESVALDAVSVVPVLLDKVVLVQMYSVDVHSGGAA